MGEAKPATRTIRIAILAMGGEGGGVLSGWIVDLAESAGWIAQQTSIPGVAQRTGATNYYLELFPRGGSRSAGPETDAPVMALSPMPGDVDIVLASELMEAGRAIQRGIVTPDRTTLITSTSRVFAMSERTVPGDGRTDEAALLEAARLAARRLVAVDLGKIADDTGSVISAVMLGALAAAEALPFAAQDFEATIERGGVGVASSKRGFSRGMAAARGESAPEPGQVGTAAVSAPAPVRTSAYTSLLTEAGTDFPEAVREIVQEGVRRLTDYQDAAYARLFLARLRPVLDLDRANGGGEWRLTREAARHLALGMAYEDTIRVAEMKVRASRLTRIAKEMRVQDRQMLRVAEFLHPRHQEIVESVPGWLGRFLDRNFVARRVIARLTREGRIVETTSVRGFLLLCAVAGLKPRRRSSMRFGREQKSLEQWLASIGEVASRDYALACEIAECRNLVKGYGDTHARGSEKYERIVGLLPRLGQHTEPALHVALLRKAALAEESPEHLEQAIARLGLAEPAAR